MPTNIEIKARAPDFPRQSAIAHELAGGKVELLLQEDTFFDVPHGRLKLRVFGDGTGELIQYQRADEQGPKQSEYIRTTIPDPAALGIALASALGVRNVVRKRRHLCLAGRTRIHLDEVDGLGQFIELEVVLAPGDDPSHGDAEARSLMAKLGIEPEHLVSGAYVDLLEAGQGRCVLRKARAEDATALTGLALVSKAHWGYDDAFMAACAEELRVTAELIARRPVWVCEAADAIVGYFMLDEAAAELEHLFVDPRRLGKGHGRRLMRHAQAVARQLGATTLVVQSDPYAADFYRRMGGVPAGERPSESIPGRVLPVFRFDVTGGRS